MPAKFRPIKAEVEYTVIIVVKSTIVKVKIGDTEISGRRNNPVESIKQRSDLFWTSAVFGIINMNLNLISSRYLLQLFKSISQARTSERIAASLSLDVGISKY
jgi:hypothetical protein